MPHPEIIMALPKQYLLIIYFARRGYAVLPEVSPKRLPHRYMVVTLIQHFIGNFLALYAIVTGVSISKSVEMIYQCQGVYGSFG